MPHPGHLAPVLAQHEFQEAFKNWRDLQFLDRNLSNWQDNLGVFGDMLDTRRAAYTDRLPKILDQTRDTGLAALQKRRDALAAELAQAETQGDGAAFADARQRELQALVDSARAFLEQAPRDAENDAARERLRLAAGALTWQLGRQQPDKVWDARKALQATDAGLEAARGREAAIAQAQKDEPARFDAFGKRIAELGERIKALAPRVTALAAEQQKVVQELAVAELERQKLRLDDYTIQARFAVAQIYDRAIAARSNDDAVRR
jgi:chromosome segregation ATPase